jgi:hypothetical protein
LVFQLKGEEHATLQKPPNHKLFDATKKAISPVLQRRMANQNAAAGSSSAPVFNFTLGNDLLNILRPPNPAQEAPAPVRAQNNTNTINSDLLLQPSRAPGPDLPIAQFCAEYGLSSQTAEKFAENCYTHARVLRFVAIEELKQMGFRLGEIAGLRDAVERWSIAS